MQRPLSPQQLDRYFARIGYSGARDTTLGTLRALHRAHLLTIPYENDKDLDNTIYDILQEASSIAKMRNGFIKAEVLTQEGSERYW